TPRGTSAGTAAHTERPVRLAQPRLSSRPPSLSRQALLRLCLAALRRLPWQVLLSFSPRAGAVPRPEAEATRHPAPGRERSSSPTPHTRRQSAPASHEAGSFQVPRPVHWPPALRSSRLKYSSSPARNSSGRTGPDSPVTCETPRSSRTSFWLTPDPRRAMAESTVLPVPPPPGLAPPPPPPGLIRRDRSKSSMASVSAATASEPVSGRARIPVASPITPATLPRRLIS